MGKEEILKLIDEYPNCKECSAYGDGFCYLNIVPQKVKEAFCPRYRWLNTLRKEVEE